MQDKTSNAILYSIPYCKCYVLWNVCVQDHNCVRELRILVQQQNQKMAEMQTEIAEHKLQINEQKRELQLLKVDNSVGT